jgi:hypothetical protein
MKTTVNEKGENLHFFSPVERMIEKQRERIAKAERAQADFVAWSGKTFEELKSLSSFDRSELVRKWKAEKGKLLSI